LLSHSKKSIPEKIAQEDNQHNNQQIICPHLSVTLVVLMFKKRVKRVFNFRENTLITNSQTHSKSEFEYSVMLLTENMTNLGFDGQAVLPK
jgi:hypothetical protein